MATRTSKARASLNDRIDILNKNAVEVSPAKQVFGTVTTILALVRDKMIENKESVQLSEQCFNVCEILMDAIQGKDAGDLNDSETMAMKDLDRAMRGIEGTIKKGTSTPRCKYNKEKVESLILEVRQLLGTLGSLSSHPGGNFVVSERSPRSKPIGSRDTTLTPAPGSAFERLIRRAFTPHELPSLIEVILLSKDRDETASSLPAENAQTLIDLIDEVLETPTISPLARAGCLKLLYKMCGRYALLPRAFNVPVNYNRASDALYRGGCSDVWKGECRGCEVAVKVIRTYSKSELQSVINRFCKEAVTWKFLQHPNVLSPMGVMMSETRFALVSEWMANGNINEYIKVNASVNRLGLIADAAQGLIYMHDIGIVHGDLKASNVLIDGDGRGRLADFGISSIISDPATFSSSSSNVQTGTIRWMSPELFAPDKFGLEKSRPTVSSDCYALGMVIYEILSGNPPFHTYSDLAVALKVIKGEHPPREAGFTERLWTLLETCWASRPDARPSIRDVLQCLESDDDDCHSSDGTATSEEGISKFSGSSHAADDGLGSASFVSRPIVVGAISGADPDASISEVDSNDGSACQGMPTVLEAAVEGRKPGPDMYHIVESHPLPELSTFSSSTPDFITSGKPQLPHWRMVPQPPYTPPGSSWKRDPKASIHFLTLDSPGLRLSDALRRNFEGLNNRDAPAFDAADCSARTITIRIHFPGYPSSTEVEKTLKLHKFGEGGARSKATTMQLITRSCGASPGTISRSKLAFEVSKRIERHIEDLETNKDLFPFNDRFDQQWRLKEGNMELTRMVVTELVKVSANSWTPIIFIG